eukprot:357245-Chlamydomonas_euryale.AAC.2
MCSPLPFNPGKAPHKTRALGSCCTLRTADQKYTSSCQVVRIRQVGRPHPIRQVGRPHPIRQVGRPHPIRQVGRPHPIRQVGRPHPIRQVGRPHPIMQATCKPQVRIKLIKTGIEALPKAVCPAPL